jgi:hypothetical protein
MQFTSSNSHLSKTNFDTASPSQGRWEKILKYALEKWGFEYEDCILLVQVMVKYEHSNEPSAYINGKAFLD